MKIIYHLLGTKLCAGGEGRTPTLFRALAPKANVSANFTTPAVRNILKRDPHYRFLCPPSRARTYDRLLKRQLLYQLSYGRT